jgi:plastocyanin
MRNRTGILIVVALVVALFAAGGTMGALALAQGGFMRNSYGSNGMMNSQQGYQGMMGDQQTPVTGITHLTMQNYMYQPANIQVRTSTTVTWTNQDNVAHSVTFKNGMKGSGLLSQGQSFSSTFNTPGTYQYYCTVHPSMVATVTVVS